MWVTNLAFSVIVFVQLTNNFFDFCLRLCQSIKSEHLRGQKSDVLIYSSIAAFAWIRFPYILQELITRSSLGCPSSQPRANRGKLLWMFALFRFELGKRVSSFFIAVDYIERLVNCLRPNEP